MTNSRLAIDWVSPLPPVPSGIADYSADLLPHLAERVDLRVLTIPGQPVEQSLLDSYPHASLSSPATNEDRLRVYQMGNNPYHLEVYRAALEHPGVLTLHDYVLHHFHLGRCLGSGDEHGPEEYLDQLRRDHGEIGVIAGRPRLRGIHGQAAMFELPMNRSLARSQRGVIVHNRWARDGLLESSPDLAIEIVPMAMPLPELPDPSTLSALRRRLGIEDDTFLLGSFGFQTRIKRTHKVIEALASSELTKTHLLVAGKAEADLDLALEARRFGVSDRVHALGYVPFEEFVAAIRACDACLCLRYPSAGETSAALMRVLAAGRLAVVSDYRQFAELPDQVAIKAPLGAGEVEALVATLSDLAGDVAGTRQRGDEGRAWILANHDPDRVVARLVEAIEALSERSPPGPADRSTVDRFVPSTLTATRVEGNVTVNGAESPWPAGERRRLEIELTNTGSCRWLATERGAGGVVVGFELRAGDTDLTAGDPWLKLPRDLGPRESCRLTLDVRRPHVDSELVIEPHVAGGTSFGAMGGPVWRQELRATEE